MGNRLLVILPWRRNTVQQYKEHQDLERDKVMQNMAQPKGRQNIQGMQNVQEMQNNQGMWNMGHNLARHKQNMNLEQDGAKKDLVEHMEYQDLEQNKVMQDVA